MRAHRENVPEALVCQVVHSVFRPLLYIIRTTERGLISEPMNIDKSWACSLTALLSIYFQGGPTLHVGKTWCVLL